MLDEKLRESAVSVIPIIAVVSILCLFFSPVEPELLLCFLIGAIMLVLGMGLFSLGAEHSMTPIGNKVGAALTKTRNLPLIIAVSFLLGFAITIAEPDLQVLAQTVPNIKNSVLLITVGVGVGVFMSVCMIRIFTGTSLKWMLIAFYLLVFLLAFFSENEFLGIAFDSGGVTTGPMTVPFILALGVGVSNIRSDRRAEADSFGLVALCSIGPHSFGSDFRSYRQLECGRCRYCRFKIHRYHLNRKGIFKGSANIYRRNGSFNAADTCYFFGFSAYCFTS